MAYKTTIWAKVQADWKTGNFSRKQLSEKYQIPEPTIRTHTDIWDKGELKPIIEKTVQQKIVEAFAKRGFDEERVAQIVDEMGNAEKPIIIPSNQIEEVTDERTGEKVKVKQPGMADVIPDWIARDKAVTQYAKLTGAYVTDKLQVEVVGVKIDL